MEMPDGAERVFVNAAAWAKCTDRRLSAFLRYLCGGSIGDDDFTRRVDDAVRMMRQRPEWRRNRMKLERYLEEQRIKAIKEGREEGLKEGRSRERAAIAQLFGRLTEDGRAEELPAALSNGDVLDSLLSEYGLTSDAE